MKKLYTDDATKGVPPETVDKLRKMLAFLDGMEDPEELRMLPSWKAHTLTGDRKGTWSLSVTANRRLTFRIDTAEREIYDVNRHGERLLRGRSDDAEGRGAGYGSHYVPAQLPGPAE
ncbi:MAG: type II toxin-antitoxin system RelE/ParE family toxin [Acidobacteriaceae bacterium]